MAQNITWLGNQYSDVPFVSLPKTSGGTAQFTDTTPTTATAEDVLDGKIFFLADGTQATGTGSGGGTVSGDRILNAEGTYDVSSLATATYIYPTLSHAYINVSSYYWAYYTDSST